MQMNDRFLRFLKILRGQEQTAVNSRLSFVLWLLFHLAIPAALLLSLLFSGQVRINTSLFDMLPQSNIARDVREADNIFGEKNGREIIILCASSNFSNAKSAAALLYEEFKHYNEIENISFYFDSSVLDEFYRYLFDYRYVIAASDTVELLENGMADNIAHDALASAFGAFNFFSLDNLNLDPFLLAERRAMDFLSSALLSGSMTLKDDILAAEKDGIWHVMLRMTLAPGAVSLQADRNIIKRIYNYASVIKESDSQIKFYFSGVPFHSYESSSGAQSEISIISTVTLLLILLLFLFTFKSVTPVLSSVTAILISLCMAASASLLIFREIHIITFVFGTTLIGTCVDYSVHFFAHWKNKLNIKNGTEIRSHIIKNITMSFISTQICFIVFFLASFPILKQFAVFSLTGLLSSYLTFFCIYPKIKVPQREKNITPATRENLLFKLIPFQDRAVLLLKKSRIIFLPLYIFIIITLLVFNISNVKIENNLSSLYTMSDNLLESEIKTAQILDYGSSGWYFIVSGSSQQETLENEERFLIRLREEIFNRNLETFLAATIFTPSVKTQEKTYKAMEALLPLAASQFEYFGFPPEYAETFKDDFTASNVFCFPENAPSQIGVSNLWIGKQGGSYYSCVMPIKPKNEEIFKSIADEFNYVHYINKAKDISRDMDTLTKTMLLLFLGAFIIISVIIFFIFPLKDSIKICSIPVLLALSALAVLAANKISIGFFSVVALVLVFGLSLDYIFFMTGKQTKEEKKITLLGVVLSFLTTMFSFGALSFSGFMPVHLFGLTVCAGLGAAFICALILQSKEA